MKFTKEEARKELAAQLSSKVENINKWERTIKENVETLWNLLGEENEIELSDFVSKAVPLFETTAGFLRKENSDLAKSYEEKLKAKPAAADEGQETTKKDGTDSDFSKRLELLEAAYQKRELEFKTQQVKSQLSESLKSKGVKSSKWIEAMVNNTVISDDFDVESKSNEYLELYNSMMGEVDFDATPEGASKKTGEYTSNVIKEAAAIAKQQRLVGSE